MSFELHFARKRQSSQATYTRPVPSISADGSGSVRMSPGTAWSTTGATSSAAPQLAPPSVDRNARMECGWSAS